MKSSIDVMIGPAGLVNSISSTAMSYVDEVGLATLTCSSVGNYTKTLLIELLAWLNKSEAAAAIISERARDSE